MSENKLELVFSDICGPFTESFHGAVYIISFIDDFTSFAKVYFMKQKSEATEKLEEKEKKHPRGLELTMLWNTKAIHQSFSAPYSPHQNGVAESHWRTLSNMSRTMLNSSKMD